MSISEMDWSRRNANGAVAYPNNQQYLPQSTSSTVPSMTNHKAFVTPNSCSLAQTSVTNSGNNRLLKCLLGASSVEEIANIQLSALSKQPPQQTAQVSPGLYKHSSSPLQKTTTATNQQSNHNVQSTAVSSYQMQIYQNSVLNTFQQPQLVSIAQQQVQSVQQPQQMTIIQQQPQQMTIVQQHVQPMNIVQQPVQPVQQPQSMQIVQQQTQPMQQPRPMLIVQQQAQPMQQPRPMHIVQQQAQPMQQPRPMHIVQQQAQPMQQPRPMHIVQQQAQPMQQPQPVANAQQQAQPVHCYGAVGYSNREVQQVPQTAQSSGYSHRKAHQQMEKSHHSRRYSQNAQQNYQPMPQPNAQTVYSIPNGNSGPYATSYKTLNDKNVPVLSSNYQNGQNIQTQMGANFQTNTLQSQQDMNNYGQSPPKQMMPSLHSGFANNSSNVLPSATRQPPPYPQSNTNASNVYNVSVNQRLAHPTQNFSAQNIQQPVQSYTAPQDQPSVTVPPSTNVQQDQRANVLQLLKVYRNVKLKYLLLNRENNLLRQKLQSSSQDNSSTVKPPLISSLPDNLIPSSDLINGNEAMINSSVQSRPPSNTHGAQTPTLCNNSLNGQNVSQSSTHVYPTNGDVLNQRNYAGQMNTGSSTNSGQAIGSGTLRGQNPQETLVGSIQANNPYLSGDTFDNLNLSQDGLCITSVQSLSQTPPTSESCNPVHTTNTSNIYSNKPLTFSSREAIKASLPLWKSVPQCSTATEYLEPKPPMVDNGHNSSSNSEEIVSNSINEAATIPMTQKLEHSGPVAPKGIEPQIAIVSPLVQIKEFVNEISQNPKGQDLPNSGIDGFKDNDCFNKLLSVDAAVIMNNTEKVQPGTPYNVEVSSNCNMDQTNTDNDSGDDSFQISGICTLVEGNSNYDSSIAMMFDGTLPIPKTDLDDEHTLQLSQGEINMCDASQSTSSFSPTIQLTTVKSEPEGEIEPHEDGSNVCLQTLPENNLLPSDVFDLEPDTVSDQLSELLTEFPFGIKNYISEKSTEVSIGNFRETEVLKTTVPLLCDSESKPIEDIKLENAMDTSTTEMESPKIEDAQQCVADEVCTPELPTDEGAQLEEDCFDICESPDENIHITLLDPDQMNKLFPEDSTNPVVDSTNPVVDSTNPVVDSTNPVVDYKESLVESFGKESKAPVVDDSERAIKETSASETTSVPDKELFCCLFSWLTHTNGNAPKCNCKLTDLGETKDLANSFSQTAALITAQPPADVNDPIRESLEPLTEDFKPCFPDPCKVKLEERNIEILPPVLKRPKLEPIEHPLESEHNKPIENYSPKEVVQAKMDLPVNKYLQDQFRKELMTYYNSTNEKAFQSKSHLGDPNGKKNKDPFSGSKPKDDEPPKLDKLIIKTDFLKNKHLLKMKRKYKEKLSRVEEGGAKNVQNNKSTEKSESPKTYNMERIVEGKVGEKRKTSASAAQQPDGRTNKRKSSSSSDRSHSQSQTPPQEKRRGRGKSRSESHFDKVRKVPTVQEYLERKRELCNKRSGPKMDQRDEPTDVTSKIADKHSLLTKMLLNNQTQKGQPKSGGAYENVHKKHRGSSSSHGKGSLANKGSDQKSTSSKIYLSLVTDGSRRASCEGINLTKLQIRCSPEKPGYYERRKSLDSSVRSKQSKYETKNKESPKMLEFKLYPEFDHRSPTTQERKGEQKVVKEKNVVEGIKSKKEAWCSGGPGKKVWMDSGSEDQGRHSPSQSAPSSKSSQKTSSRPVQDTQATFNAFKQMYHEKRSKSLDGSL